MDWLNSVPINLLTKDLDGLWLRQQAISGNLANWETPGYKSKEVSFEEELQKSLSSQSEQKKSEMLHAIDDTQPQVTVSQALSQRMDGNNVDVVQQNTEIARTQFNYMYSMRELSDYFSRLRYVITDGKG
ncbi:flagellar basal body rod protein FlgB [Faecalispora anaeroviscerum]|uniref:flagellar basal body rod protein FlgB n=1 Tax=Faecalispora anaeroviscerum TaxID=2991836 RepID=UPI0024B8DA1C|nr:flagellar basal body rod protein FlgB [Faecalispora anaeroviscerum]